MPPFCSGCGNAIGPHPDELQALVNQGVITEGELICLDNFLKCDLAIIFSKRTASFARPGS